MSSKSIVHIEMAEYENLKNQVALYRKALQSIVMTVTDEVMTGHSVPKSNIESCFELHGIPFNMPALDDSLVVISWKQYQEFVAGKDATPQINQR